MRHKGDHREHRKQADFFGRRVTHTRRMILFVLVAILIATPLSFSREVLTQYTLPQFTVLLLGSTILAGLLCGYVLYERKFLCLRSPFSLLMGAYITTITISTIFSVDPVISFQGSFIRQMGFITHLCFAVCFFSVIVVVNNDRKHFESLLRAIVFTGFLVSAYGLAQIAGLAPVAEQSLQQFRVPSGGEQIFRVDATFGHPDFAGNFLLYIVFTSLGAVAITKNKWQRLFAIATSAIAIVSTIFTGTRGAWVGLIIGAALCMVLIFVERRSLLNEVSSKNRLRVTAALLVFLLLLATLIASTELGSPIRARLLAFYTEGFSGAGRTTLWRLALRMLPEYWLTGCGLEMFQIASLPFKTADVAVLGGGINPEDPHSAYMGSLISTGLFSTLLYLSLIVFALRYLLLSVRHAHRSSDKWLSIGLLASFSAVLVHNIFLFSLVSTGLYFFIFLALSYCCYYVVTAKEIAAKVRSKAKPETGLQGVRRTRERLFWIACSLPLLAALSYSYKLIIADQCMLYCQKAAKSGDYNQTLYYGNRATDLFLYQTDYHAHFARALEILINTNPNLNAEEILKMAVTHLEKAVNKTLSPDRCLLYMAELNMQLGNFDIAQQNILKAEQIDPYTSLTHLVWGRFFLSKGDLDKAAAEVEEARSLGGESWAINNLEKEIKDVRRDRNRRESKPNHKRLVQKE